MAWIGLFILIISMFLVSVTAREFLVGGKDGWVVKPAQDYSNWATKNRFQVNDTLREEGFVLILGLHADFKYNKESDSVVVVKKEDFDSCNANNPIQKLDDGDSIYQLPNSGLYYFISGNPDNCKNGQKLIVLVMAVRRPLPAAAPPPATTLPPQKVPAAGLVAPAPPPLDKSGSGRVGVGLGVVLMLTGFVGM
ncbi:Early nodulin-like protein 2, partial [Mucuna pruriens]